MRELVPQHRGHTVTNRILNPLQTGFSAEFMGACIREIVVGTEGSIQGWNEVKKSLLRNGVAELWPAAIPAVVTTTADGALKMRRHTVRSKHWASCHWGAFEGLRRWQSIQVTSDDLRLCCLATFTGVGIRVKKAVILLLLCCRHLAWIALHPTMHTEQVLLSLCVYQEVNECVPQGDVLPTGSETTNWLQSPHYMKKTLALNEDIEHACTLNWSNAVEQSTPVCYWTH